MTGYSFLYLFLYIPQTHTINRSGRARPLLHGKTSRTLIDLCSDTQPTHRWGTKVTLGPWEYLLNSPSCPKAWKAVWEKNQTCSTGKLRFYSYNTISGFSLNAKLKKEKRKEGSFTPLASPVPILGCHDNTQLLHILFIYSPTLFPLNQGNGNHGGHLPSKVFHWWNPTNTCLQVVPTF